MCWVNWQINKCIWQCFTCTCCKFREFVKFLILSKIEIIQNISWNGKHWKVISSIFWPQCVIFSISRLMILHLFFVMTGAYYYWSFTCCRISIFLSLFAHTQWGEIISEEAFINLPKFTGNSSDFYTKVRDIHIECSKQFKWNLYFYGSGQSGSFLAELKLL